MEVTVVDLRNLIGAVIFGLIAWGILFGIAKSFNDTSAKQVLTQIALANGLMIGVGLSPNVATAEAIVNITPILNYQASAFIGNLVNIATFLDLLFGSLIMYDKGKAPAFCAFFLAFASGYVIPVAPLFGVCTWAFASLISRFSPNTGF